MRQFLNVLKYILFIALGVGLLLYTFRNQSIPEIIDKLSKADLGWVLLSLLLSTLALISRAWRWNLLIEPLGYKPKLSSSFHSLMIGYLANLAIPRIGELTRCGSLSKAEKIPFNKLIGTVIIERVSDVIMLIVSILILALLEYQLIGSFLFNQILHPIIEKLFSSVNLIIIFILIMAVLVIIVRKWLKSPSSNNLKLRIKTFLTEISEGLRSVLKMKSGKAFILHSLFIWAMYFLMTYINFFALQSTAHLNMKAGLFVMVVGGIAMSAPVQGGIGTYHLLVSQGLLLYNLTLDDGIIFATLVHTWQLILLIVLGLFAVLALFLHNRKPVSDELPVGHKK